MRIWEFFRYDDLLRVGVRRVHRLCADRSRSPVQHDCVQFDVDGKTLAHASTLSRDVREKVKESAKTDAAKAVGVAIAKALIAKGFDKVVFDRNGYIYHGRIKALADAAREAGLKF